MRLRNPRWRFEGTCPSTSASPPLGYRSPDSIFSVVVIHHGRILYDGPLTGLAGQFVAYKTIGVAVENGNADLSRYGEVIHTEGDWITLRVPKADTSSVTARLLTEEQVLDLNVEDPPIEDVIELVFAQERPE